MRARCALLLLLLCTRTAWAAGGITRLDSSATDVTIGNSTTETTMYTYNLPGGTIGSDGCVMQEMIGTLTAAVGQTITLKLYYDTATLSILGTAPNVASPEQFAAWVTICGDGATGAQVARLEWRSTNSPNFSQRAGLFAIDTTQTKPLTLTIKWTATSASNVFTKTYASTFK